MSNILILSPYAPSNVVASSSAAAFPVSNLEDTQPKIIWRSGGVGSVSLDVDLGADKPVDTVFLGFTNAGGTSTWTIRMASTSQGVSHLSNSASIVKTSSALAADPNSAIARPHALWHGAARMVRYIRLNLSDGAQPLEAGVIAVGKAFVPQYNIEWGAGRSVTDLSQINTLRGGAADVVEDAIVPRYRFTLGDLQDGEVRALWQVVKAHGRSRPLLVVEDPAQSEDLQEAIHFGTLADIAEYERLNPKKSRWEFTIQQWL